MRRKLKNTLWENSHYISHYVITFLLMTILLLLLFRNTGAETSVWQKLDEGLYLGEFNPRQQSQICDYNVIIIKIIPKFFSFHLLSASEHDNKLRTAKEWCSEFGLLAAINASMYQIDFLTSTGYMKNYNHTNNRHINKNFGSFMAFNPVDPSLPEVRIIDRRLQKNWEKLIKKYNTVIQNYRIISNGKKTGWPQQDQVYTTTAIGMDVEDNVLFILSRSLYSIHDFINILLSLPINITNAMYVEGGPEGSLYLKTDDQEMNLIGICYQDSDVHNSEIGSKIPNVIGISKSK